MNMETTTDIQNVKSELINQISEINKDIERKLSVMCVHRCNCVVVSKDFLYYVCCNDKNEAYVGFTTKDMACRFTQKEAERIARVFHAENGYGKIEWVVMPTRQYLQRLLKHNQDTIKTLQSI